MRAMRGDYPPTRTCHLRTLWGSIMRRASFGLIALLSLGVVAHAQTPGTMTAPSEEAPEAAPAADVAPGVRRPQVPAKVLFGAAKSAAPLEARAIGFYSRGCLAGAKPVSVDGPAWQVMRLSRNRNWGHPALTAWVERFAQDAKSLEGWSGLLIGDMSQPRGGPMLTGHASHQIGLDADIWLTPMPDRQLTRQEREEMSATSMLPGGNEKSPSVDPKIWTQTHLKMIRRAANYPQVERILVHPAIKKALCDGAAAVSTDRNWLGKVRPYWGHHYHMHVRMSCPPDSPNCRPQAVPSGDDGCGQELVDWFKLINPPPRPPMPPLPPGTVLVKPKPKPQITLDTLPGECRVVLETGGGPKAR
jgi:penicillin-insensitive murein DD-endopeptidase